MWYYLWILSRWTLNVVHCFRSGNNIANVLPSEHCIWSTVTKGMGCWLFTLHLIVKCDLSSSTTSFPLLTLTAAQSSPCLQTSNVLTYVTVVTGCVAFLFVHDMKSILVIDLHCDTHELVADNCSSLGKATYPTYVTSTSSVETKCCIPYKNVNCLWFAMYMPICILTKMLLKLFRP